MRKNWATREDFNEYLMLVVDPAHRLFGKMITYGRDFAETTGDTLTADLKLYEWRVYQLRLNWNPQRTDRILVLGCGFGFMLEVFQKEGFPNVFGMDNSPWIWENMAKEAAPGSIIVDADMTDRAAAVPKLWEATGSPYFDWVITEGVLESYREGELPEILDQIERYLEPGHKLDRAIHIVAINPGLDPVYTLKTLEEWKAVRPSHSWIG